MPDIEVVEKSTPELVSNLFRMGVDERTIAAAAGISVTEVRDFSSTSITLNDADSELADAMRVLAWTAYEEAMNMMIYGAPSERAAMVRTIIGRTMGLVGMQTTTHMDEMRSEFNKIMQATRGSQEVILPTDEAREALNAARISPPTFLIDDSDERPDD